MKYLLFSLSMIFSSLAMSSTGYSANTSAATPYVPCFVDGEYVGTIEISHCHAQHGSMTKD